MQIGKKTGVDLLEIIEGVKVKHFTVKGFINGSATCEVGKIIGFAGTSRKVCERLEKSEDIPDEQALDLYLYPTKAEEQAVAWIERSGYLPILGLTWYLYFKTTFHPYISYALILLWIYLVATSYSSLYKYSFLVDKRRLEVIGTNIYVHGLQTYTIESKKIDTEYVTHTRNIKWVPVYDATEVKKRKFTGLLLENDQLRSEVKSLRVLNANIQEDLVRSKEISVKLREKAEKGELEEE